MLIVNLDRGLEHDRNVARQNRSDVLQIERVSELQLLLWKRGPTPLEMLRGFLCSCSTWSCRRCRELRTNMKLTMYDDPRR